MESGSRILFTKLPATGESPQEGVLVFPIRVGNGMHIAIEVSKDGEEGLLQTSPVQALAPDPHIENMYLVETRNSTYQVQIKGSVYDDPTS